MNWKPTAVAAVAVSALGLGAGLLIGGKTETRTVTETVTVAADEPSEPIDTAEPLEEEQDGVESRSGGEMPVGPDDVRLDDTTRSSAADMSVTIEDFDIGVPVQLQQGEEVLESMAFSFGTTPFDDAAAADYYEMELTVPHDARRFRSTIGFVKGSVSGNNVRVQFFENSVDDDNRLQTFDVESARQVEAVDLDVSDASVLVIRYTCTNEGRVWRVPEFENPRFGFLEPIFVL